MRAARLGSGSGIAPALLALALSCEGRARAAEQLPEHPSSSLQWVRLAGSESCIGSQALARAVEERLGRSVFVSPTQGDLAVEGHVSAVKAGFQATLSVARRDGSIVGSRQLSVEGDSCEKLAEGLIVVIALLIDPAGEAAPAPQRSQPPAAPAPSEPAWAFTAHGGVGALAGPVPAVAPLLELGIGMRSRTGWAALASFVGTLATHSEDATARGELRLYLAELSLCRRLATLGTVEAGVCAGVAAGGVTGEAEQLQLSTPQTQLYGGALGHGWLGWHAAGPLWLEAELGAGLAWYRPTFQYRHLDEQRLALAEVELWQSQLWAARATLRVRLSF